MKKKSHLTNCEIKRCIRDQPSLKLAGGGGGVRALWFFVSFKKFFTDNTRVRIFILFQNLTLSYMTKTLNQIFFFLHQNQIIFSSNIGNQNIFLEKKNISSPSPPTPLEVKWSVP